MRAASSRQARQMVKSPNMGEVVRARHELTLTFDDFCVSQARARAHAAAARDAVDDVTPRGRRHARRDAAVMIERRHTLARRMNERTIGFFGVSLPSRRRRGVADAVKNTRKMRFATTNRQANTVNITRKPRAPPPPPTTTTVHQFLETNALRHTASTPNPQGSAAC